MRFSMASYLDPSVLNKSSAIPHAAFPINTKPVKKNDDKFQICYAGRIWSEYQNINVFLEGFALFTSNNKLGDKASFVFVGIDEAGFEMQVEKFGLAGQVKSLGKLPYLGAMRVAQESTVLLLIDPKDADGMILTSKLVDYVQTGRPILAMTTKDSTTERLMKGQGVGLCVDGEQPGKVAEALATLYQSWKEGSIDQGYSSHKAQCVFEPTTIIDTYRKIFDRLNSPERSN
jgi:glycosyltransferase involved in cell wall biosynthesis